MKHISITMFFLVILNSCYDDKTGNSHSSCFENQDSIKYYSTISHGCGDFDYTNKNNFRINKLKKFHIEKSINNFQYLTINSQHDFVIDTCYTISNTDMLNVVLYEIPKKKNAKEIFNSIPACSDIFCSDCRNPISYKATKYKVKLELINMSTDFLINAIIIEANFNLSGIDTIVRNELFYKVKIEGSPTGKFILSKDMIK